ncbi:hypothetical protein ACWGLF_31300 [Streptomyces puniciscabiei]
MPGQAVPTAGRCTAKAIRQTPPGSAFCLRDTTSGDIAVVTVIDVDHGNHATTDDITCYRRRR